MIKAISQNSQVKITQTGDREPIESPNFFKVFLDIFDKSVDYPLAEVNIRYKSVKKKRKHAHREVFPIEDAPTKFPLGRTAFHCAALAADRNWIKFLCEHALDETLMQADVCGKTPLHYAAERQVLDDFVRGRRRIDQLLEISDGDGNTPLHIMAKVKKFDRTILYGLDAAVVSRLLHIKNTAHETVLEILGHSFSLPLRERG